MRPVKALIAAAAAKAHTLYAGSSCPRKVAPNVSTVAINDNMPMILESENLFGSTSDIVCSF